VRDHQVEIARERLTQVRPLPRRPRCPSVPRPAPDRSIHIVPKRSAARYASVRPIFPRSCDRNAAAPWQKPLCHSAGAEPLRMATRRERAASGRDKGEHALCAVGALPQAARRPSLTPTTRLRGPHSGGIRAPPRHTEGKPGSPQSSPASSPRFRRARYSQAAADTRNPGSPRADPRTSRRG